MHLSSHGGEHKNVEAMVAIATPTYMLHIADKGIYPCLYYSGSMKPQDKELRMQRPSEKQIMAD